MTTRPLPHTSPAARWVRSRIAALAIGGIVLPMLGCPSKPPPPTPPPPPPPPPKKAPEPEPVRTDALLQTMGVDARVQFPQAKAPTDEGLARAAISLADAIVRGDADKLRPMLSVPARSVLEQLGSSGDWDEATGKLDAARIVYAGTSPMGGGMLTVIALQDPDGAYLLGWAGARTGSGWTFTNIPTAGDVKARASEWDSVSVNGLIDMGAADSLLDSLPPEIADAAREALDKMTQPDGQPDESGPPTKRTPVGPVTIPKPGGA